MRRAYNSFSQRLKIPKRRLKSLGPGTVRLATSSLIGSLSASVSLLMGSSVASTVESLLEVVVIGCSSSDASMAGLWLEER